MRMFAIILIVIGLSGCYGSDDMVRDAFNMLGDAYYDEVVKPVYNEKQTSYVPDNRKEMVYYHVDRISREMEVRYGVDMSDIDIMFNLDNEEYIGYAHVFLFGHGNLVRFDPEYVNEASDYNLEKLVIHELAHVANAKMNWLRALENAHGCSFQQILIDFGVEPNHGHDERVCVG